MFLCRPAASLFPYEVQFGHAGACATGQTETADAKNSALKAVGVRVPQSFEDFGDILNELYVELVNKGTILVRAEPPVPSIPVDYEWANKLGLIRKPSAFVSSIVDERGEELVYAGMKISDVISSTLGIGGTIGLIWFRKRLPDYFCRFIELVLMVTADHGPAVAGAHNTIVAARAGKDLISSLCSGLLTIGPRFGGALDGAAQQFAGGYDSGLSAEDFMTKMRRDKELIMGIGKSRSIAFTVCVRWRCHAVAMHALVSVVLPVHSPSFVRIFFCSSFFFLSFLSLLFSSSSGHKIKSLENPDVRVVIIKEFAKKHFATTEVLDFALGVEQLTTKKKSNLILNVDGCIGVCFVDLLRSCGAFTLEEAQQYIEMGTLNGLFVLGRSVGFIGHFLDQNRLKQGLYRHPTDDISYITNM